MPKIFSFAALCAVLAALTLSGCAGDKPTGVIYTSSSYNIEGVGGTIANLKMGMSQAKCYFGLVGVGDCSIDAAVKNGGIKEIRYIDRSLESLLGVSTITTKVYGN